MTKSILSFLGFLCFLWLLAGIVIMFAVAGGWKGYGNDVLTNSYRDAYHLIKSL